MKIIKLQVETIDHFECKMKRYLHYYQEQSIHKDDVVIDCIDRLQSEFRAMMIATATQCGPHSESLLPL